MPRPASARARCTHPLTCANCLALPSEMNLVPQMEMQKSPVFCVAHAGSCRPELFLFGHLGSSTRMIFLTFYSPHSIIFDPNYSRDWIKNKWMWHTGSISNHSFSPAGLMCSETNLKHSPSSFSMVTGFQGKLYQEKEHQTKVMSPFLTSDAASILPHSIHQECDGWSCCSCITTRRKDFADVLRMETKKSSLDQEELLEEQHSTNLHIDLV
ncbi:uncharacterized protein LOC129136978 [Pan troglodytes]|uniref:uncharacterized protein LOC129136978 n=1 Tax=Pan troglodytes TaxID=9598 RepID=UPI003013D3A2